MNTINDVQLCTTGAKDLAPAKTAEEHPLRDSEQKIVLLNLGHRDHRFGADPVMGKDTCGY